MDKLFDKLENQTRHESYNQHDWSQWSLEEKHALLQMYYSICKNEHKLFDLVYGNHDCDSFEDIFRDFDSVELENKQYGVEIALQNIQNKIREQQQQPTQQPNTLWQNEGTSLTYYDSDEDYIMKYNKHMGNVEHQYEPMELTINNDVENDVDDDELLRALGIDKSQEDIDELLEFLNEPVDLIASAREDAG